MIQGPIHQYLAGDHDRLDSLLEEAVAKPGVIGNQPYEEFRRGLLRHIAMEEKIVFPAIAHLQGGRQATGVDRLRLDHGAMAALLVPSPTAAVVAMMRSILQVHNVLEEQEGGVYQLLEELVGSEAEKFLDRLKSTPAVPVLPHNDLPGVIDATRRAVERAGYSFKDATG